MVEKADAGDIIAQSPVRIDREDTALSLSRKLTKAALELLKETYPRIKAGTAPRTPQDPSLATIFGGRRPKDGEIDWKQPAEAVYNLVRAVTHPYPGAFTFREGKKLFLWYASLEGQANMKTESGLPGAVTGIVKGKGLLVSAGHGSLLATRLQLEGEEELPADVFAERYQITIGARFGR
jgi:methionyl-tRNA formyltransferase